MNRFGTTSEQLGAIAVGQRAWAADEPAGPVPRPDHARRPPGLAVGRPSRCTCSTAAWCPTAAIAVVVTSAERAAHLPQPPVHVWGWAQTHPGYRLRAGLGLGPRVSGAAIAGPRAMAMAGITPADVDVREIYDCYTYTTLITLEDYGFCAKGEGGALAASGALGPGGALPTNTGGGQLSSYYLWGMTPLSEAVIQVRGQGGERQVPRHEVGDRQRQRRRPRLPQHARAREPGPRAMRTSRSSVTRRRRRSSTPPPTVSSSCGAARCAGELFPPAQRRVPSRARPRRGSASQGTATLVTWAVDDGHDDGAGAGQRAPATVRSSASSSSTRASGCNTALPGVDAASLRDGLPMCVSFIALGGGEPVPVFVPA